MTKIMERIKGKDKSFWLKIVVGFLVAITVVCYMTTEIIEMLIECGVIE